MDHLQHMDESLMNKSHRNESCSRRDSFVPNKTYCVVATDHLQHMDESHILCEINLTWMSHIPNVTHSHPRRHMGLLRLVGSLKLSLLQKSPIK